MTQSLEPYQPGEIALAVEQFSSELTSYLKALGLPAENVLAEIDERRTVINNLPDVVARLTDQQRLAAFYVSKFIAACATGLFDAALNFIWNETVRNLREKAARFDLVYFFDSVVTDSNRRSKFKTEADLEKLDDWELMRGCLTTGLITEIGYKHLDYVREMRNWASAAHPNQNELSGLQVVSWLDTCIREVLAKEPAGPVIEVRKLLRSLREEKLSSDDVDPIAATLPALPDDLSRSLLRTIVGMYTDTALSADTRNNIKLVARAVWEVCSEESKYEAGLKFSSLGANAEVSRARLAREFLELVDGLVYLPPDRLALEISTALDTLMMIHDGFNNFYNEPSPARQLQRLIPSSGEVPLSVIKKYVKTVTMCKVGSAYGVSWAAEPIYDDLIGRFSDKHIHWFVQLPFVPEFQSRLQFERCAEAYQGLATHLRKQTASAQLRQALKYVEGFRADRLSNLHADAQFKRYRATK
jgi:hypothetical protein